MYKRAMIAIRRKQEVRFSGKYFESAPHKELGTNP